MRERRLGHTDLDPNKLEQRASDRAPVAMGARCRVDNGIRDHVALVDLTTNGCCVLTKEPFLRKGQKVTLQPESLAGLPARVQWSDHCLAGLRFDNPLYGPVFEHLARTFPRSAGPRPERSAGYGVLRLPEAYREELLRKINEAEMRDLPQEKTDASRYRRLGIPGPRPGIRTQRKDGQVLRLFR